MPPKKRGLSEEQPQMEKGKGKEKPQDVDSGLQEKFEKAIARWTRKAPHYHPARGFPESPEFELYNSLFSIDPHLRKDPSFPQEIQKIQQQHNLSKKHPDRFHLSLAEKVFDSFIADSVKPELLKPVTVYFKHDNVPYRAEVRTQDTVFKRKECQEFLISLPNDGFLYPDPANLQIWDPIPKERHDTPGWIMLDLIEAQNKLGALRRFSTTALQLRRPSLKKPNFKLYYNFYYNMLDLQAIDPETYDKICISFHCGHPEEDFDDAWLPMPDDQ